MSSMLAKYAGNPSGARGFVACCGMLPLIISATFCGVYWSMWADAQDFDTLLGEGAYDSCGLAGLAGLGAALNAIAA